MKTLVIEALVIIAVIALLALVPVLARRAHAQSPDVDSQLAGWLTDLLSKHGVPAVLVENRATVPSAGFSLSGAITRVLTNPRGLTVQLDILAQTRDGKTIVESFAGPGKDMDSAVKTAFGKFVVSSFHVFLSAFVSADDESTERQTWTVAGKPRTVVLGPVVITGKYPAGGPESNFWCATLTNIVQSADLPAGTHWVRMYYDRFGSEDPTCEVLLDNQPWENAQKQIAALPWPVAEQYYGVRFFMILRDESVGESTP